MNSKEMCEEIENLQLSDTTCERRAENLSEVLFSTITEELRECQCFSLALDTSTDLTSTSQLILYVRYCSKEGLIKEEF